MNGRALKTSLSYEQELFLIAAISTLLCALCWPCKLKMAEKKKRNGTSKKAQVLEL